MMRYGRNIAASDTPASMILLCVRCRHRMRIIGSLACPNGPSALDEKVCGLFRVLNLVSAWQCMCPVLHV